MACAPEMVFEVKHKSLVYWDVGIMTNRFCGEYKNSRRKSATASRAWPLPGAFLIPPALLVVADLSFLS
jgi:hypothetical protein